MDRDSTDRVRASIMRQHRQRMSQRLDDISRRVGLLSDRLMELEIALAEARREFNAQR